MSESGAYMVDASLGLFCRRCAVAEVRRLDQQARARTLTLQEIPLRHVCSRRPGGSAP